jgi:hypothetical protein
VDGTINPLTESFDQVFEKTDSRWKTCLTASAGGDASLGLTAKAWLGDWSASATWPFVSPQWTYGSWTLPDQCDTAPPGPGDGNPGTGGGGGGTGGGAGGGTGTGGDNPFTVTGQVRESDASSWRNEWVQLQVDSAPKATAQDSTGISVSCTADKAIPDPNTSTFSYFYGGRWYAFWHPTDEGTNMPFVGRTYVCKVDAHDVTGKVIASQTLALADTSAVDWGMQARLSDIPIWIVQWPQGTQSVRATCTAVAFVPGSNSGDARASGQQFTVFSNSVPMAPDTAWGLDLSLVPMSYQYACTVTMYSDAAGTVPNYSTSGTMYTAGIIG